MKLVRNAVAHKFQLKVSTCNSGLSEEKDTIKEKKRKDRTYTCFVFCRVNPIIKEIINTINGRPVRNKPTNSVY